jgi:molecular chaperone GrpE
MADEERDRAEPGRNAPEPEEEPAGGGEAPQEAAAEEARPVEEGDELPKLRSRLMYLAAEFDNYRKRVAREKETLLAYGNERLLQAILPSLDNLERALSQSGASGSVEALLTGVRLTYDQLLSELRKFGLEQMETVGETFDPRFHEAVALVPWEGKPEGTVLAEARKGYLLNGRLLRPAQVTVAQQPAESESAPFEGDDGDISGRER